MSDYNQANRLLTLKTVLGANALLPGEVVGAEGMSSLFSFDVTALASVAVIERTDILGTSATLGLGFHNAAGTRTFRYVNGIVSSIAAGDFSRGGQRMFHLRISPKLWLLDRTTNCAVYNNLMKVKDVIETVLRRNGLTATFKLTKTYPDKEFRIQYNETDLDFVRRIAADEGLFFYFEHTADAHELVFADDADYPDCALAAVEYRQGAARASNVISSIRERQVLADAGWKHVQYDFEAPATPPSGETKSTVANNSAGKVTDNYAFGHGPADAAALKKRSTDRIEEMEAASTVLEGQSSCAALVPGHTFELTVAENEGSGGRYVVSTIEHRASDPVFLNQQKPELPSYSSRFTALPAARIARPAPLPRPSMQGAFVAKVVGPAEAEVYTDAHGRIRVEFPWDQKGAGDEKSSCFVRVAQSWAGKAWGSFYLPRVGMEVIVQFAGGDPDQPLVTGALYNGTNTPPFPLPAEKTKSGVRTRSMDKGSAQTFSELSFDDKKDSEKVFFRAQKDFDRKVLNDDTLDVGNDQTRTIKNNRTQTITDGNDSLTVSKGNRSTTVDKGNDTHDVKTGNRLVNVDTGNDTLNVKTGNLAVTVDKGNVTHSIKLGNVTMKATAGEITLEAGMGITLKVGSSTIKVTPQGVQIEGLAIGAKASMKADVEGAMVTVKGSAMTEVSGGLVKIN